MRTKKGIKELITGIIIGEGVRITDLEENAVDRIIEALIEENNLIIPDVSDTLSGFREWQKENWKDIYLYNNDFMIKTYLATL
mgnify:CR=1 FL=1|tara:strand:+ start:285 stop:533 length:249 start_codon:yes stop_codon:yes gene_type:complete